jgi:hypothetical protein
MTDGVQNVNGIHLTRTERWSDNNHFASVEYYKWMLEEISSINRPLEAVMKNAAHTTNYTCKVQVAQHLYGAPDESPYLEHLDGRLQYMVDNEESLKEATGIGMTGNTTRIEAATSSPSATTAAAANANANANVVASVQVEKKEPSSSSTIADPSSSSTSACHTSLNEMTISMAKYSSPPGSKSFLKHQRIFAHATKFHILRHGPKNNIFSDITQNLIQMFESYGLVESLNEIIDSDMEGNHTIMVELSFNHHDKVPAKCTGSTCHTIPRISIQAEQITKKAWAPDFVHGCHASPNCLIWDFSDKNFDWAKTLPTNASESFLIVPHMFHDRLRGWYPKDENEIKPYGERSEDAVFFGAYTSRRKVFENKFINNNDGTLSRYKVTFRKKMRPFRVLTEGYSNAKICLVVHSRW